MNGDPKLIAVIVSVLVLYAATAVILWRRMVRRRARYREIEDNFVSIILKASKNGAAISLADTIDLYRAHFDQHTLSIGDRINLSQLIRRAQLSIAAEGTYVHTKDIRDTLTLLRKFVAENEAHVRQEEIKVPFSDTPSPERQLLLDVLELTAGDRDAIRVKLTDLANAIGARHDTIERLGNEGRQSLKWAKRGLAGTVVFSLVSIALGAWAIFQ